MTTAQPDRLDRIERNAASPIFCTLRAGYAPDIVRKMLHQNGLHLAQQKASKPGQERRIQITHSSQLPERTTDQPE